MPTDKREAIISKIKKLLEMTEGNGATQAEAVAFALKAQKLIAEYDVQDFELGQSADEPIEEVASNARTTRQWRGLLASVVADNFRCKALINYSYENRHSKKRSASVKFYGYRHDAQAAAIVFEHLYEAGEKLAREYVARAKKGLEPGHRLSTRTCHDSFVAGFVRGVKSELEKQSQALMLVMPKEVLDSWSEHSKGFKKASIKHSTGNAEAEEQGFRDGRDAVRSGRLNEASSAMLPAA